MLIKLIKYSNDNNYLFMDNKRNSYLIFTMVFSAN